MSRLIQAVPVILGAATVVFFLVRLSGDPVLLMVPPDATPEQIESLRHSLGYTDPLYLQYGRFLLRMASGDLGMSLKYRQPALPLILERMPATIELSLAAMLLAVAVGVPAGVIAAARRGTWADRLVSVFALLGQAVPPMWFGLILILLFAVRWGMAPTSGYGELDHLILPAVTLAAYLVAAIARLTRSEVLGVLRSDYIRTARSKGLGDRTVLFRHALKNALIPVVTIMGLQLGGLLGGAVITETVFAWPGVGRLMVQSIGARDYPMVQAAILVIVVLFVLINIAVDLMYSLLDPRIRHD